MSEGNPNPESAAEVEFKVLRDILADAREHPCPTDPMAFADGVLEHAVILRKMAANGIMFKQDAEEMGMAIVRLASHVASYLLQASVTGFEHPEDW